MFPDTSTGEDHGWPITAVLAKIWFTAVPLGAAFWYQTATRLPEASSATVPLYALLARVACVAHDPAEALVPAMNVRAKASIARILHFIRISFIAAGDTNLVG